MSLGNPGALAEGGAGRGVRGRALSIPRDRVIALDEGDPLASTLDDLLLMPGVTYLAGHSLGRPTAAAAARVGEVVTSEWAGLGVAAWERWAERMVLVADELATVALGARSGEVVVGESTTIELYQLVAAAAAARPDRRVLVGVAEDFPTDRYVLDGIAARLGLEVRRAEAGPFEAGGDPTGAVAALESVLDEHVCVAVVPHVHFRSAAVADLALLASAAHRVGALLLVDSSHGVGAVPLDLDDAGVDLAVGATYKHLCAGPGAPAFAFVRAGLVEELMPPIWGWWAHETPFAMRAGFAPQDGVRRFQPGTPPVVATAGLAAAVAHLGAVGLAQARGRGIALGALALELAAEDLAPRGFSVVGPDAADLRGAHLTLSHPRAAELVEALAIRGVMVDHRPPSVVRVGMTPLATRFVEVWDGMAALAAAADTLAAT